MNETNNKLSTEQLNKMSIEEILAFNGFKKANNELVRLEETKGSVLSLDPSCTPLTIKTPASLTIGPPIGPSSIPFGTTSVTYTVLITNSGDTDYSSGTNVTLYEGNHPTWISTEGSDNVPGHGTYLMTYTFNPSGWAAGSYTICAVIGEYPFLP